MLRRSPRLPRRPESLIHAGAALFYSTERDAQVAQQLAVQPGGSGVNPLRDTHD
jgi:hypothetical protein